jgi:hypothetical protein
MNYLNISFLFLFLFPFALCEPEKIEAKIVDYTLKHGAHKHYLVETTYDCWIVVELPFKLTLSTSKVIDHIRCTIPVCPYWMFKEEAYKLMDTYVNGTNVWVYVDKNNLPHYEQAYEHQPIHGVCTFVNSHNPWSNNMVMNNKEFDVYITDLNANPEFVPIIDKKSNNNPISETGNKNFEATPENKSSEEQNTNKKGSNGLTLGEWLILSVLLVFGAILGYGYYQKWKQDKEERILPAYEAINF